VRARARVGRVVGGGGGGGGGLVGTPKRLGVERRDGKLIGN